MKSSALSLAVALLLAVPAFAQFKKGENGTLNGLQLSQLIDTGVTRYTDPETGRLFRVAFPAGRDRLAGLFADVPFVSYTFVHGPEGCYSLTWQGVHTEYDAQGRVLTEGEPSFTAVTLAEAAPAAAGERVESKSAAARDAGKID